MKRLSICQINDVLLFFVLLAVLYYGRDILIIVVFSAFLAMLMAPLANKDFFKKEKGEE